MKKLVYSAVQALEADLVSLNKLSRCVNCPGMQTVQVCQLIRRQPTHSFV